MKQSAYPPPAGEKSKLRSFWSLNGVMFQGALSDNIFKLLLMMLVIQVARSEFPGDDTAATAQAGKYQMYVEAAFILPFILAVSLAGWLSDRFSKTQVTRGTKVLETVTMTLAVITLALESPWLSTAVLFIMGMQSALFSPSKYGILPELLPEKKLAWGNGILQGWTFLAIIVGTIVGPWIYGRFEDRLWMPGLLLVAMAAAGFGLAMTMVPIPAAAPRERFSVNPLPMVRRYGREILSDTGLKWSVFGMIVWWMVAVMCQGAAILVAQQVLGLSPAETGVALLPIVVGLGLGCMLTGLISRHRIEMGLVPLGALAMSLTCLVVWWATPEVEDLRNLSPETLSRLQVVLPVLMGLVGLVCGFFIVPLQSFVLQTSDPAVRGGIWAASNVMTSLGMISGALLKGVIVMATASPGAVFLAGGLLMLLTGTVICLRFPMIPLRFLLSVVFRFFYRVRAKGLENIPKEGGALIAVNHQSYLDAILVGCVSERSIRFLMSEDLYRKWFVWPIARLTRSIPISRRQPIRSMLNSLKEAKREIRNGGLVGIFPEGQMTRIGMLQPFQRGATRIMKGLKEPIIPAAIDGAYDSSMALRGGRFRFRFRTPWPRRPMNLAVGEPLPSDTTSFVLRQRITDLIADAFAFRKEDAQPLHRTALRTLRKRPFSKDMSDHQSEDPVSRSRILAGAVILGQRLRERWGTEDTVGILLPPSLAALTVNLAATLAGRTSVNLNYTSSRSILEQVCAKSRLRLILTSRAFLEKTNLEVPEGLETVHLEDLREGITFGKRMAALARGLFQPLSALERHLGRQRPAKMDDVATLIFSSGSTGVPKGVPLTHWNIASNILGAWQMIRMPAGSCLLGILPFFHSFGYTANLWLPLYRKVGIAFCPNPLDAFAVGHTVERYQVTHLLATPTFLSIYARRVPPNQFGSLFFVLTGAEKLQPSVAETFEKRFGLRPIEGYGCTECAPIISMSTTDYRGQGMFQQGNRRGTVGRPLPGITLRIEDVESGEELGPNAPGLLLVKGPNVMSGYFGLPEVTAEVLRDGWYLTGDVAQLDEDGLLTITDRLSRFSKISGEMVPHIRIEEVLHELAGVDEPSFVVTGIPDERRGERLAVLYTLPEEPARSAAERLKRSGLPPLWIPKWNDFIAVNTIPLLGSGKMNLQQIRAIAKSALSNGERQMKLKSS